MGKPTSITFDFFGEPRTLRITKTEYAYGGLALQTWSNDGYWEEWATVTKFFYPLKDGFAYLDANNCGYIADALIEQGYATIAGIPFHSGFCEYPYVEFDHDWLTSMQTSDEFFAEVNGE